MNEIAAALEATALAQHLKASVWTYPLVNAGHILGLALLVGAVVPMDLRLLGVTRRGSLADAVALLRPVAMAGLALTVLCGALLFVTQAGDYVASPLFRIKMALVALALVNIALHPGLATRAPNRQRIAAGASLLLWPLILLLGRLVGYG